MTMTPSSARLQDPGIRALFERNSRWQSWLDVEAALAQAQARIGMIPTASATIITAKAHLQLLDENKIVDGLARTGHPLVPLVWELARVCGEEAGGHVHWGATTQNILETGDALLLKKTLSIYRQQFARLFSALAALAERTADTPITGRTNGQQALPVTFGFKVAAWIDEFGRHLERIDNLSPRVLVATLGGAVGTFASFGAQGPALQTEFAKTLQLGVTPVPSRTHLDRAAEYITCLGLIAGTTGKIAKEIYTLCKQEFGEAGEPVPEGAVGSSTMPQKRNPVMVQDLMADSVAVRALVPQALESMLVEHEADRTSSLVMRNAIATGSALIGDSLERLIITLEGLWVDPERMLNNLGLTGGMILSESIMLELGKVIGRQEAHDVVYDAAQAVLDGTTSFANALTQAPQVKAHLSADAVHAMLDPTSYTGLSGDIAREQAEVARGLARELSTGSHQ